MAIDSKMDLKAIGQPGCKFRAKLLFVLGIRGYYSGMVLARHTGQAFRACRTNAQDDHIAWILSSGILSIDGNANLAYNLAQ